MCVCLNFSQSLKSEIYVNIGIIANYTSHIIGRVTFLLSIIVTLFHLKYKIH